MANANNSAAQEVAQGYLPGLFQEDAGPESKRFKNENGEILPKALLDFRKHVRQVLIDRGELGNEITDEKINQTVAEILQQLNNKETGNELQELGEAEKEEMKRKTIDKMFPDSKAANYIRFRNRIAVRQRFGDFVRLGLKKKVLMANTAKGKLKNNFFITQLKDVNRSIKLALSELIWENMTRVNCPNTMDLEGN